MYFFQPFPDQTAIEVGIDLSRWLILGLRPANERRRYIVMTSPIGWVQA